MNNGRIFGLDIMRIISMLFIVGLHLINNGGIIEKTPVLSFKYLALIIMLVFFYTSVNLFAIMTGYLSCNKKVFKSSRLIELLSIMLFYCFFIYLFIFIFDKSLLGDFTFKNTINNLFPFLFGRYWYIVSYCVVFVLMPYLNNFIKKVDNNTFKKLLITFFIIFSVIQSFLPFEDLLKINKGYSPFWLIYMYFIGAYINNNEEQLKNKINLKKTLFLIIFICLINIIYRVVSYLVFKKVLFDDMLVSFISPFNIFLSIVLFICFLKLNIKKQHFRKTFEQISLSAFSVYIIHSNIIIFDNYLNNYYLLTNDLDSFQLFLFIIVSILGIYIVCFIIDLFRIFIYKLFRINFLINKTGCLIDKKNKGDYYI